MLSSGGGHFTCLWRCHLLSVPSGEQASRKDAGLLWPGQIKWCEGASAPCDTGMCRGHGVPEIEYPRNRQ